MSQAEITAQQLLERILASGKDVIAQTKAQSGELTAKGKDLAAKGEDILIDKLGIEDTEVSRAALRKGVGTGAAAGALALLLSSRSGRKLATMGGLAALGTVAYKSYQKNGGKMPANWKDEITGLLKGPKAEARSEAILRAMVAAAKADGEISDDEMVIMKALDSSALPALKKALDQEPNAKDIASLADSPQLAREIYAASCRVADGLNPRERDYLDNLAMAMKMDPELAARIETDVRTG